NVRDQRAAGIDLDLTKNRTTAAPLHPMVLPNLSIKLHMRWTEFAVKFEQQVKVVYRMTSIDQPEAVCEKDL
ncbi:hypothetical protein, partial [Rhodopirellula europaea]|uniref:hypothetical protein n=1 Tax=Rhodopirellula europaea TaxID=1263866 RepID=UPI001F3B4F97